MFRPYATVSLKQDRKINQLTSLDERQIKKWVAEKKGLPHKKVAVSIRGVFSAVVF